MSEGSDRKRSGRQEALAVLTEAEDLCGPSMILAEKRKRLGDSRASSWRKPQGAWEFDSLCRLHLRSGELEKAAPEAEEAVRLEPEGFWPNFHHGLCAYRQGHFTAAATAFSVCIGADPSSAICFYDRGRAFAALGQAELALRDYDKALRLDPKLGAAALNRALLHLNVFFAPALTRGIR